MFIHRSVCMIEKVLLDAIEKGFQWTAEQIPLVVQEKLAYDFWSSAIAATLLLGLGIGAPFIGRWIAKRPGFGADDGDISYATVLASFVGVVPILVGSGYAFTVMKIYLAPRLYVLEWLRGLL